MEQDFPHQGYPGFDVGGAEGSFPTLQSLVEVHTS